MKTAFKALTAVLLIAILVSTSAYSAVEIDRENKADEQKREFNGWGNYDVLSNVYPDYKSQDIRDNYYVGLMDQTYRNAAKAPNADAAMKALTVKGTMGNVMNGVLSQVLSSIQGKPVAGGLYDKITTFDTVSDGTGAVMKYVTEIDSIDSLAKMKDFVTGGSSHPSGTFAKEILMSDIDGKAAVSVTYGAYSRSQLYSMEPTMAQSQNLALFEYMLQKVFPGDAAKVDSYKTAFSEIDDALWATKETGQQDNDHTYAEVAAAYSILGDDLKAYSEKNTKFSIENGAWMTVLDTYYKDPAKLACMKALAMYDLLTDSAIYLDGTYFVKIAEIYGMPADFNTFITNALFGDTPLAMYVGKFYAQKYVTDQLLSATTALLRETADCAKAYFNSLSWLSQGTKDNINLKFQNMRYAVDTPTAEQWSYYTYSALSSLSATSALYDYITTLRGCEESNRAVQSELDASLLYRMAPPQLPNASYSAGRNTISLSVGYVVYFVEDFSKATQEEIYAKLCTTIGHEFTHAFDNEGCNFDDQGNMSEGWLFKGNDKAVFDERTAKLKAYISTQKYYVSGGTTIYMNADKTVGEVMADMGGLEIAELMASKMPNFNYKAFYEAYGKIYFGVYTNAHFETRFLPDEHPSGMFRVDMTLQQSQRFADTYGLTESDGMYLQPEKRVSVWA